MNGETTVVLQVVVWTCVVLFLVTGVLTILALLGKVKLGGGTPDRHDYYLKRLFLALLIEIVGVSVIAYGAYVNPAKDKIESISKQPPTKEPTASLPINPPPAIVRENIVASVYATSDGPTSDEKVVQIPPDWTYVTHTIRETTKNGRSTYSANPIVDPAGKVTAVKLSASVGSRDLFGPRNWVGAELTVIVERRATS